MKKVSAIICLGFVCYGLHTTVTFAESNSSREVFRLKGGSEFALSSVSITFLDVETAKAAIIDDSLDPYFNQLQQMEMSAKTGSAISGKTLKEQRNECRRLYQEGVRTFTEEEKETLCWYVKGLYPILSQQYPVFAQMPWSFLKVSNQIECGLPHTRGKHIILSENACKQLMMLRQSYPKLAILHTQGGELLISEQMHVFQHTHPRVFDSLYTEIWGFVRAKQIETCPWLKEHHLANPDATDCSWVFPTQQKKNATYIWPLVVLAERKGLKRIPNDLRTIAVELDKTNKGFRVKVGKDGKPVLRDLMDIPEYCKVFFPLSYNIFHPHEASSLLFAKIVMFDKIVTLPELMQQVNLPENERQAFVPLRKWFQENLGEKHR